MWLIIIMTAVVVAVAIAAGMVPFVRRRGDGLASFPDAEAVTAGIFLGAGLNHMLGDAAAGFDAQGIKYPWPMLLAGAVLLALLWLEHAGHAVRGGASLAALATQTSRVKLGTLVTGRTADLIAVEGDPSVRIEDLRSIKTVIKGGRTVVKEGVVLD